MLKICVFLIESVTTTNEKYHDIILSTFIFFYIEYCVILIYNLIRFKGQIRKTK